LFAEVCDWIATPNLGHLSRCSWQPRFGVEIEWYVGDVHVAEVEASEGEEISLLKKGQMTPVKLVSQPYVADETLRKGQS
jgi:hypothetical protein